jgi:DNA-binding XRE family transcriptional regulator
LLGRRDHALIGTGFYAGLRAAELATLTLARVDLAGDSAALRVLGKGQRERIVPVVPTLRAILTAYLRDTRPALEAAGGPSPYVFLRVPKADPGGPHGEGVYRTVSYGRRRAGLPLTTRTVWRIVVDRLRPLLGPGFSPHKMRHSFGSRVRWNAGDPQVLQQLLGHVSISTTMVYSHLPTRGRAAEVARLLAPTGPIAAALEATGRARRRDARPGAHVTIGARILAVRHRLGLTQAGFAAHLGVSRRGLDQAELGHVIPHALTLQAIAAAGGVTVAWLLAGD